MSSRRRSGLRCLGAALCVAALWGCESRQPVEPELRPPIVEEPPAEEQEEGDPDEEPSDEGQGAPDSFEVELSARGPHLPEAFKALPVGLRERPTPKRCVAPSRPKLGRGLRLVPMFQGREFEQAIDMVPSPIEGEERVWYVLGRTGVVWRVHEDEPPTHREAPLFLDVRLSQRVERMMHGGLLGLAFSPTFKEDRRVYVFTTPTRPKLLSRLARYTVGEDGRADPASEEILLELPQQTNIHKGGHLEFGPDGYLYVGIGDDVFGDPEGLSQKTSSLLGKMLRLDVSPKRGYAIPPDNPFVGRKGAREEIWAVGLRNPWRFSIDRESGEMWASDVGHTSREEINLITPGGNYGWPILEGTRCYRRMQNCDRPDLLPPVHEYTHRDGSSVTGGYVYHGDAIPWLRGQYVFADFVSGTIWGLTRAKGDQPKRVDVLADTPRFFSAFAEGPDRELYVIDYGNMRGDQPSRVFRLEASIEEPTSERRGPARLLSQTGCVDPKDPWTPDPGFIPYAPNAPFWSDGATKRRWLMLPPDTWITTRDDGDWDLPIGAVILKDFMMDGVKLETRMMVRHKDGTWGGYSYAWNDTQTDATLVTEARKDRPNGILWVYPGRGQCVQCHTAAAGRTLGLETAQINGPIDYGDGRVANQVVTLARLGMLDLPEDTRLADLPAYPDPHGTAPLPDRARAYLHTNCAFCHRPDHPSQAEMDMRFDTPLPDTHLCDVNPTVPVGGFPTAKRLQPGASRNSMLWQRMRYRNIYGMPPIGSARVDYEGTKLIHYWILGLEGCDGPG